MKIRGNPGIKTTLIVLAVLLLVIAAISFWRYGLFGDSSDNNKNTDTSQESTNDTITYEEDSSSDETNTPPVTDTGDETSTPDPNLFSSLSIESVGVDVYYSKGTPGFSYNVLRTPSGTTYIEFQSEELIGAKCTDDQGVFASIIKNPSSSESQTVTATTKVGVDEYGLSLASNTCTGDLTLLEKYQTAFKNGFSSLRATVDQ